MYTIDLLLDAMLENTGESVAAEAVFWNMGTREERHKEQEG